MKFSAKQKAEGKLLQQLCAKHGYSMLDAPSGNRTTMVFERDRRTNKSMVKVYRCVLLAVPDESALGAQLVDRYATKAKGKR